VSQASFEEVVRAWLLDYDGRLPNGNRERKEAFLVLLVNLANYGYGKEELNTGKKEKIVRSCVNPNHHNKKKLRVWISIVVNDLEDAILIYYGNIKINRDVITPEMSAKLDGLDKKAEETRALRTEDNGEEEEDTFSLENHVPLDIESAVKDAVANPTKPKQETFEITDDLLKDTEGPTIVWDEDFMKKLESGDE
jgi:hypothetical protein